MIKKAVKLTTHGKILQTSPIISQKLLILKQGNLNQFKKQIIKRR